jgi:hypothetical protein
MPKKITSFKLVQDRFLTKKFKNKSQHELSFWFNELAPENDWFTGEIAFKGVEIHSKQKKLFAFAVYVNQDHNTIMLAELESDNIINEQDLLDSLVVGKEIISVMRAENVDEIVWGDSDKFQKALHNALIRYIDKKGMRDFRQRLLK